MLVGVGCGGPRLIIRGNDVDSSFVLFWGGVSIIFGVGVGLVQFLRYRWSRLSIVFGGGAVCELETDRMLGPSSGGVRFRLHTGKFVGK